MWEGKKGNYQITMNSSGYKPKNRNEWKRETKPGISQSVGSCCIYETIPRGQELLSVSLFLLLNLSLSLSLNLSLSLSLLPKSLPSLRVDSYSRIFLGTNIYFKIYNFILGFLQVTIYSSPAPPFSSDHILSLSLFHTHTHSLFHIHTHSLPLYISPPLT